MNIKDIKVLFLAHYAPQNLNAPVITEKKDEVYSKYHFDVFQILKELFPSSISSSDPAIMLRSKLNIDYIFSLYNRMPFRNSEVFISAIAEYHCIPYLGASPNIRALAEDKHLGKMMALYAGVNTPKWKVYNVGLDITPPDFKPPYFCKPRFGAASIGIDEQSSCSSWEEAYTRIRSLHNQDLDVILEEQIIGVYHTSPVLNNFNDPIFLPCISQHSILRNGIVTYEQKRKIAPGLTRNIVTNKNLQKCIIDATQKMYFLVQPLDYTRFDYIVDSVSNIPYFLEFNVCCNLGQHSTINQAASAIGINYKELITNITYSSMFRYGLLDNACGKKF